MICLSFSVPLQLKISFSESQLERTFQYPSESSLLEEFGPPEESESLSCTNPHGDDDDEEEELLLLHRGLPGLLRTKPLIVGAYLRTSAGAVAWIMVDWRALTPHTPSSYSRLTSLVGGNLI
ncbi:hypothetical protein lerEdw1_010545 [Lerista edwardsae]|nr:hypothetical protein lerEdw1_010545 [Lerista edwardsae]